MMTKSSIQANFETLSPHFCLSPTVSLRPDLRVVLHHQT